MNVIFYKCIVSVLLFLAGLAFVMGTIVAVSDWAADNFVGGIAAFLTGLILAFFSSLFAAALFQEKVEDR